MGLVTQTITFTAGIKPTASAWTNQFTTLYNLVNGSLDSANVDKVSADGIMVLDTAQTRTAALTMSTAGLAFSGAISASSWTTNGLVLKTAAATYTDSSTAGSGTAATGVFTSFGVPTLAATNTSVTTTDAATVYIAGAPAAGTNQTLTNAYALWVDAGKVRFDGGGTLSGTWTDLGTVTTIDINGGTIDGAIIGGAVTAAGTFTTLTATTSITGTLATAAQGNITSLGTIASLVATTADINAGTFDGVVGGTTPAAGTFTTLIGTNVDGIVGANTPAAGTFTSVGVGSGAITTTGTLGAGATTVTSLNASDGNITNVGDISLDSISSDAGTSINVVLGSDAGDDFLVDTDKFCVSGDTGYVGVGTATPTNGLSVEVAVVSDYVAEFHNDHATAGQSYGVRIHAGTNASDSAFDVVDQTNSTNYFNVRGDGKIAVGGGSMVIGLGAIATTATDGFLYIPSCAGTPTGTPTDYSNTSAIVHDTTNNRIYLYDHVSNAWQYAALT